VPRAKHRTIADSDDILAQHHVAELSVTDSGMTECQGFDGLDPNVKKSVVALRTADGICKLHSLSTKPQSVAIAGESIGFRFTVAANWIWQPTAAIWNWLVRKKVRLLEKHP